MFALNDCRFTSARGHQLLDMVSSSDGSIVTVESTVASDWWPLQQGGGRLMHGITQERKGGWKMFFEMNLICCRGLLSAKQLRRKVKLLDPAHESHTCFPVEYFWEKTEDPPPPVKHMSALYRTLCFHTLLSLLFYGCSHMMCVFLSFLQNGNLKFMVKQANKTPPPLVSAAATRHLPTPYLQWSSLKKSLVN